MSTATVNATSAHPSTIREHKLQQVERANATGLRNSGVTEIAEIPNRGHALTIDNGWQDVANSALIHPALHVAQHVISK